ncbi:MAG: hypothetical protein ABIY52_02480 [Gemmatimonadaceae bacterium]
MRHTLFVALAVIAAAPALRAQATSAVRVDLPVVDAPYVSTSGLRAPSMAQSLGITETFYEVTHPAIQRAFGSHTKLANTALVLFDTFGATLPAADAWLHEEFHRAVLGNQRISSFDDIYKMNLLASTVAVSHVTDEDLIRLKSTHPIDEVRAAAAGIEGENVLMLGLEKKRFFQGSRANHIPLYWLTKINSWMYVASGTTSENDSLTDEMNAQDGTNVAARDWVGHDFSAWVYDLHRPAEAYAARGTHPSGVGIDRYVAARTLSDEERSFLAREGRLQMINFLDPNLFGVDGFTVRSMRLNVNASHYLTSFGHSIDLNVFVKQDDANLLVSMHRYTNGARSFPGVEAQLLDVPLALAGMNLDMSPRVALWMQPDAQAFRTTDAKAGALASLRIGHVSASRFGSFVELEAKTEGWVAGNVNLDRNFSVRVGTSLRVN